MHEGLTVNFLDPEYLPGNHKGKQYLTTNKMKHIHTSYSHIPSMRGLFTSCSQYSNSKLIVTI